MFSLADRGDLKQTDKLYSQVQPPLDKDKKKKKVAAVLTKAPSKDEKSSKEKTEVLQSPYHNN